MLRMAEGWKTNIAGGGTAKPHELEESLVDLSVKATRVIGLEYSGVDLLRSEIDGTVYVVELNSTPGWQGLQTVTARNIAGIVAEHILSKAN
jgi:ribosomal protein S6--L-glutamate ligase